MSSALHPTPNAQRLSHASHGIIVATDGREAADAALLAARALAPVGPLGVLTVVPIESVAASAGEGDKSATGAAEQIALIQGQIERLFGEGTGVHIESRLGYPPAALTAYAETHGAGLLVVGIGRARVIDRLMGDESTLRLARMSKTPIFAVAPDRSVPARRLIVGVDFTQASVRAARLAVELAMPDADIVIAHVETPAERAWPESSLRRVVDAVQTGFCGNVYGRWLRGDPATELLALASGWGADAIAIGLQGHGQFNCGEPAGIGNVATRVIRCASCSVIVAPRGE
jgi:nucleotide-binding universal stress UspA family protein